MTGISAFEEYLMNKGFIPYFWNDNHKLEPYTKNNVSYSSLGLCTLVYVKNDKSVSYGLHEYKHQPCLIYPRPKIKVIRKREKEDSILPLFKEIYDDYDFDIKKDIELIKNLSLYKHQVWNEDFDSSIDILFQNESLDTIFDSLWNKSKEFVYDLTND